MNSYNHIKLGPEASQYVRECLSNGHTLSKCLLEIKDLNRGSVFISVPLSVDVTRTANNFRHGPLLPESMVERSVDNDLEDNSKMTILPVPQTDEILVRIIQDYLDGDRGRVCVFEDCIARPSDPWLRTSKRSAWKNFEDEVYYFLTSRDSTLSKIGQAIKDANRVYPPLIGAMMKMSEMQSFGFGKMTMTLNILKELARATDKIIIGAYDGEGYLIWSDS